MLYVLLQHILTPSLLHIEAWSEPFGVTFQYTGYPFSVVFRHAFLHYFK